MQRETRDLAQICFSFGLAFVLDFLMLTACYSAKGGPGVAHEPLAILPRYRFWVFPWLVCCKFVSSCTEETGVQEQLGSDCSRARLTDMACSSHALSQHPMRVAGECGLCCAIE